MTGIDNKETQEDIERRQFFRLDMEKELIDIIWQDSAGNDHKKKIACLDFSRGGLKVDCDCEIAAQTYMTVVLNPLVPNSQKLFAQVIRCIKQDNGWFEIALQLKERPES